MKGSSFKDLAEGFALIGAFAFGVVAIIVVLEAVFNLIW